MRSGGADVWTNHMSETKSPAHISEVPSYYRHFKKKTQTACAAHVDSISGPAVKTQAMCCAAAPCHRPHNSIMGAWPVLHYSPCHALNLSCTPCWLAQRADTANSQHQIHPPAAVSAPLLFADATRLVKSGGLDPACADTVMTCDTPVHMTTSHLQLNELYVQMLQLTAEA